MTSTRTTAGLLAGLLTVTLWASLPVLRDLINLPPMLTAAVAMGAAALMAQLMGWRGAPAGAAAWRRRKFWLMGVGGLTGALYFYFSALSKGDPAKITLVTYLWPLGFMLVADLLAGRGLRARTLLGSAVAFAGLVPLVLSNGQGEPTSTLCTRRRLWRLLDHVFALSAGTRCIVLGRVQIFVCRRCGCLLGTAPSIRNRPRTHDRHGLGGSGAHRCRPLRTGLYYLGLRPATQFFHAVGRVDVFRTYHFFLVSDPGGTRRL